LPAQLPKQIQTRFPPDSSQAQDGPAGEDIESERLRE
jgi:hypothetical protein